jgi:sulfur carrier protein ThiS
MKVKIRDIQFGEKEIELERGDVRELVSKLKLSDNGVIVVRGSDILTADDKLNDGDILDVIEVYSGG